MKVGSTRIFAGASAVPSMHGTAARGGLFRRIGGDGAWVALDNGLPAAAEVHAILTRRDGADLLSRRDRVGARPSRAIHLPVAGRVQH